MEEQICYLAAVIADFYMDITVGLCTCRDRADYCKNRNKSAIRHYGNRPAIGN